MFILISGSPADGFDFIGPFGSAEDVEALTETRAFRNESWWIAKLTDPQADLLVDEPFPWWVPYQEIVDSFALAMSAEHINERTINTIKQTVEDFAVNNLGDE